MTCHFEGIEIKFGTIATFFIGHSLGLDQSNRNKILYCQVYYFNVYAFFLLVRKVIFYQNIGFFRSKFDTILVFCNQNFGSKVNISQN